MYLKTDFSQAENICPDIEFIVMFEKRDKPAATNVSIDGKSKDKRTIFADEQAPFRKKPFFTQNIIGNDKNLYYLLLLLCFLLFLLHFYDIFPKSKKKKNR